MAFVDIINSENKYDYPDDYELRQHRRSSVAVEWYRVHNDSTVLLGITRAYRLYIKMHTAWRHTYMTVIFLLHFHFHF